MKIVVCLALLTAVIAGCGESDEPALDTGTSPAATAAPDTLVPSPNADQAKALLDELAEVHPGLRIEDSIDNARNTCTSITGGVKPEILLESTKTRFEGDGIETMSDEQASQAIEIVKRSEWCAGAGAASASSPVNCLDEAGVEYIARNADNERLVGDGEIANVHTHSSDAAAQAFYDQLYPAVRAKTEVIDRRTVLYSQGTDGPLAATVADCGLPAVG